MTTIRELFHEIGNWHNKISVGAGVTREMLRHQSKDKPLPQEVRDMLTKKLTELEQLAVGADKVLVKLKDIVYSIIDPDTGKPR